MQRHLFSKAGIGEWCYTVVTILSFIHALSLFLFFVVHVIKTTSHCCHILGQTHKMPSFCLWHIVNNKNLIRRILFEIYKINAKKFSITLGSSVLTRSFCVQTSQIFLEAHHPSSPLVGSSWVQQVSDTGEGAKLLQDMAASQCSWWGVLWLFPQSWMPS